MLSTPLRRRTRRVLCFVAAVLPIIQALSGLLGETFGFFGMFLLALYLFFITWLNKSTSNIATAKSRKLDERQRALRDRAYRVTYTAFVLYAAFMVAVNGLGFGDVVVSYGVVEQSVNFILLTLNLFVLATLPILYVAWLEPDPPEDETTPGLEQAV